jgi:uracil phosphoribosyltransferase
MHVTDDPRVTVVEHPLVQHKLSILRDVETGAKQFRELVYELAMLEAYEATRGFSLMEVQVQTPLAMATTKELAGKKVAVIPILRAGLGMVEGILELIPAAKVGHIGLYRDPVTLEPVEYYCKLPEDIGERDILIVDPMLATGGSAAAAVRFLRERGGKQIKLLTIISAPEGIARVLESDPDVQIYTLSVDERLNDHGYIVPGLGDAGDRLFGTK